MCCMIMTSVQKYQSIVFIKLLYYWNKKNVLSKCMCFTWCKHVNMRYYLLTLCTNVHVYICVFIWSITSISTFKCSHIRKAWLILKLYVRYPFHPSSCPNLLLYWTTLFSCYTNIAVIPKLLFCFAVANLILKLSLRLSRIVFEASTQWGCFYWPSPPPNKCKYCLDAVCSLHWRGRQDVIKPCINGCLLHQSSMAGRSTRWWAAFWGLIFNQTIRSSTLFY